MIGITPTLFIIAFLSLSLSSPIHQSQWTLLSARLQSQVTAIGHKVGELPWKEGEIPITDHYAGYIPIKRTESHVNASLFYWFFPAQEPLQENPPLILWLQGGPGSSSMIALFYEMGPIHVDSNLTLSRNEYTWNKHYSMLFIDNPVGTGFSFLGSPHKQHSNGTDPTEPPRKGGSTSVARDIFPKPDQLHESCTHSYRKASFDVTPEYSKEGFVMNQPAVASDLISVLDGFYDLFPAQRKSPLYITGESYAGKYVPSASYFIDLENEKRQKQASKSMIPLTGFAIGNGLHDPLTQLDAYAPMALALGFVSPIQAQHLESLARESQTLLCQLKFSDSLDKRLALLDAFREFSGDVNWYDVRTGNIHNDWSHMNAFLRLPNVKRALNVDPDATFGADSRVFPNLAKDIMKSSFHYLEHLVHNPRSRQQYQILLFQGQFDFRDGVLSSNEWIDSLHVPGYNASLRRVVTVENPERDEKHRSQVAFYLTETKGFQRAEVLGAGHMVPMNQGFVSRVMIDQFIEKSRYLQ